MKVSTAALSFLVFVAALGSQARIIQETRELLKTNHQLELASVEKHQMVTDDGTEGEGPEDAVQDPSDCCFSYTSRRIICSNFVDYFLTSGGCIQPGVIFVTNTGRRVCAKPSDLRVQKCMSRLRRRPKVIQQI